MANNPSDLLNNLNNYKYLVSRFSAVEVNLPSHKKNVRIALSSDPLTSLLRLYSGITKQVSLQKSLTYSEFDDLLRL